MNTKNFPNKKWENIGSGEWFLIKKEYERIDFKLDNNPKNEKFVDLIFKVYKEILD